MAKEALAKLNAKQTNYLEVLSSLINRAKVNNLQMEFDNKRGKLRGYLECLCDMGVITASEVKALYLWYFSENRNKTL